METFVVDQKFWEIFPEAKIFTLVVNGIDNHIPSDVSSYQQILNQAEEKAQVYLTEPDFKDNPVIAQWREAFSQFKKKKGARASIEALLKRVAQGRTFTPINPLVDLYNSVSLEYGVPCGGEDLAKIAGTMHLGLASGNEEFYPIGATKNEPPRTDEIIYYDQTGAVCRSLNWRDGERTMLTEDTTSAILIMEAVNEEQKDRTNTAINALQEKIATKLGVKGTIQEFTK